MSIDWDKLAQIESLKEYFEADYSGFREQIEHYMQKLQPIDGAELDKLAILRVLEVTNGCTQWGFRLKQEQALSVEQTRKCMRIVIGFIKHKQIDIPNRDPICFAPGTAQLIEQGKTLYQDAFKNQIPEAEQEYFAYSTGQFLVYGPQRLQMAMDFVQEHFQWLFGNYYLQRGRDYILPYIAAFSSGSEPITLGNPPTERLA